MKMRLESVAFPISTLSLLLVTVVLTGCPNEHACMCGNTIRAAADVYPQDGGTMTILNDGVSGPAPGHYSWEGKVGSLAMFSFSPASGEVFTEWKTTPPSPLDGCPAKSYTFTVTENLQVVPQIPRFHVAIIYNNTYGDYITVQNGYTEFDYTVIDSTTILRVGGTWGTVIGLFAVPGPGRCFFRYYGDDTGMGGDDWSYYCGVADYCLVRNETFRAEFQTLCNPPNCGTTSVTFEQDGLGYINGGVGGFFGIPQIYVGNLGYLCFPRCKVGLLQALPERGWQFDHWEWLSPEPSEWVMAGNAPSGGLLRFQQTDVTQCKAIFSRKPILKEVVQGKGYITRSPSSYSYFKGTEVSLTATACPAGIPAETCPVSRFDHWEGDIDPSEDITSRTITVTMDMDRELTAVFL